MRKLPSDRKAGKRPRQAGVPRAVPRVRTARHTDTYTTCGPATWTPCEVWDDVYTPTVRTFTCYLPAARPASLNVKAWSRGAAVSAARKRRALRDEAHARVMAAVPPASRAPQPYLSRVIAVTITRDYTRQKFDDDNWTGAAKPVRDGVADAFGLPDDAHCFMWKYSQRKTKAYGVEIQIEVIQ